MEGGGKRDRKLTGRLAVRQLLRFLIIQLTSHRSSCVGSGKSNDSSAMIVVVSRAFLAVETSNAVRYDTHHVSNFAVEKFTLVSPGGWLRFGRSHGLEADRFWNGRKFRWKKRKDYLAMSFPLLLYSFVNRKGVFFF
uniref:Uncharacterized protein n=1 Tax=Salix viminalis TaxID=40686 RepID=A0A6N2K5S8_SALVM